MQVLSINSYQISVNTNLKNTSFCSAKDITLEYVIKNHSKYLPERIKAEIRRLLRTTDKNLPQLFELHNTIYKPLFDAKTLDEVKSAFPEFKEVLDISAIKENRSKAIPLIQKNSSLDIFTLDYLKKLYKPTAQDILVKEYGLTNRNLLLWLNKKLNIEKLSGTYIKLLQMSDEKENSRIAKLSRKALTADSEVQSYRLLRAAEAHRTPEYKEKKRQEMINFYKNNPEKAKRIGLVSQRTWDLCPEIKKAFSEYTKTLSPHIRRILSKKLAGQPLSVDERRITFGYYKGFWEKHEELKSVYRDRRIQAIAELQQNNLNKT